MTAVNNNDSHLEIILRLNNKTALITGTASGLGKAMAIRFAEEGANVIICDIDEKKGLSVANMIGSEALFRKLDVTSEKQWVGVTNSIDKLDILINNAGITSLCRIENVSLEVFRKEMDIDVFGLLVGCKHGMAKMKNQGGCSIINMSSSCTIRAEMEMVIYSADKAGVSSITKSVSMDCAKNSYGIH